MSDARPDVGFLVHNDGNTLGGQEIAHNRDFLAAYLAVTKDVIWEDTNLRRLVRKLALQSAHYSEACMTNIVCGCWLLHAWLPRLKELGLTWGLLDYRMLRTLANHLAAIPDDEDCAEIWEQMDIFLVECLSPTVPNQALPTARWLGNKIRDELVRLGLYDDFKDPNSGRVDFDSPEAPYGVEVLHTSDPSVSVLQVTLATEDAHEARQTIAADAKSEKVPQERVVMNRLCGTLSAREKARQVRIFGVGELTPADHVELVYADGTGQLTINQRRKLMRANSFRYRSIDSVATECFDEHDPTLDQMLLVMLRDGTCRFPGCNVEARFCDTDHIINWEMGGLTTLPNLQCLCRRHHNFKTDRNVMARSDVFGVVTWKLDNLEVTTVPNGPLAGQVKGLESGITGRHDHPTRDEAYYDSPPSRNGFGRWGTTLAKYRAKQRNRHLVQMTMRKRQLRDYDDIPPLGDNDVPPEEC
ncbi:HNH endonuclease signature motif containing protein [Corynebacterium canis]